MPDSHQPPEDLREMLRRMQQSPLGFTMPQPTGDAADSGEAAAADHAETLQKIRAFSLKPREVRDFLDRHVVRQEDAKKVLAVAICDHYHHVRQCLADPTLVEADYSKQNVLLLGPTGVGKTYLVRCLAKLIGVPFVKADATKFSETGYVGHDVEELARDLVKLADGDVELAQYGIIYLDEVDKIASRNGEGVRDVSGRGVQVNLLKLMEDTDVSLHSQTDMVGQMQAMMAMARGGKGRPTTINTRHMLFIVSGAFGGLAERIRRRVKGAPIGFGQVDATGADDTSFLKLVQTRDLVDYGYEPEFAGRLPVRVVCEPLSVDDLEHILRQTEGNIMGQHRAAFKGYGIALTMDDAARRTLAELAHAEGTGARGLMTVLERSFRDFKYELPSTSIKKLHVDPAVVRDPAGTLARLLAETQTAQRTVLRDEVAAFAARFQAEHGLELAFTEEAIARLIALSLESGTTIRGLCERRFKDYPYGLKLLAREGAPARFEIPVAAVDAPDATLSAWVVARFRPADAAPAATP